MTDSPDWTGNIQISGQSVVVNESISGQTVAVYSGSQYAPVQGSGKYFYGTASGVTPKFLGSVISYTVPAGKTLYIQGCSMSFLAFATLGIPDATLAQLWTGAGAVASFGMGTSGDTVIFDTPFIFAAGVTVTLYGYYNGSMASAQLVGSMWGWEQ